MSEREPTGTAPDQAQPAGNNGNGAAAPETRSPDETLSFQHDGINWVAYISGQGAYGTGRFGLASLQAIHFAHADRPNEPLFEALLAAGRFSGLYERELLDLFRAAQRIVVPEGGALPAPLVPAAGRRLAGPGRNLLRTRRPGRSGAPQGRAGQDDAEPG